MDNNTKKLSTFVLALIVLLPSAMSQKSDDQYILGTEIEERPQTQEKWEEKRKKLLLDFKKSMSDSSKKQPLADKKNVPYGVAKEVNLFREYEEAGVDSSLPGDLYQLNIGDQLYITVYGKQELNRSVTIDNYGLINFNYINTVQAAGKTLPELQQKVTEKLSEFFKHINVVVAPNIMSSQFYTLGGSVLNPGRKSIPEKTTLISAIAAAGGLRNTIDGLSTIQMTDLSRSFIIRDNKHLPVSFDRLILKGDMSQNIQIKSGDFIYLPYNTAKRIYILGEVVAPHYHLLRSRTTLVQLISRASGRTRNASDTVMVIRGSLTEPQIAEVDFAAIIAGKAKDVYLQANDIVYVPERDFIFAEELIRGALHTFVMRVASEAGSETFRGIRENNLDDDNDFIFSSGGNSSSQSASPPQQIPTN